MAKHFDQCRELDDEIIRLMVDSYNRRIFELKLEITLLKKQQKINDNKNKA